MLELPPPGALTQDQLDQIKKQILAGKPTKLWWGWKNRRLATPTLHYSTFYDHEIDLLDVTGVWWFKNYFFALAYHLRKSPPVY